MASGDGEMPETGGESASGEMKETAVLRGKTAPIGAESSDREGARPDFRVVQPEYDSRIGKTVFKDVGAMWRGISKSGNEFYTLKIGKLRLLVFHNDKP